MVFYFESTAVKPPAKLYMGRDKEENEQLIRWGWPEDIWFHTDKLSSAHVYIRLNKGQTIEDVAPALILDCAQLTKANSISGTKQNNVPIVYTPWTNLKKTGEMVTGQIGFHKQKNVRTIMVEKKLNEIVNRLNKTKTPDMTVDFQAQREARDAEERKETKIVQEQEKKEEREREKLEMADKELRSYDRLMHESNMSSNRHDPIDEDDFM